MKLEMMNHQLSVSAQLNTADLAQLSSQGVEILICSRPDGEADNQALFSEILQAAHKVGIQAEHLPFVGSEMSQQLINEFARHISTGKRIHGYCRTGNRVKMLWQASQTTATQQQGKENTISSSQSTGIPHFDVVIIGAGSGGISVAASLLKRLPKTRIALIDPASDHYYQPGWTMVGGGVFDQTSTRRAMKNLIPNGVSWIKQAVIGFDEKADRVHLDNDSAIHYEHLVIAAGLKLDWQGIEGLTETLGKNGVTSNYRYDLAPYTWELVQELKQGKAIFTQPPMPIKCAGAPQKALYLSADYWYKNGVQENIDLNFYNAGGVLFGVKEYVPALSSYMEKYQAKLHFSHTLTKIDGESKTAWFSTKSEDGSDITVSSNFDMIHVCPPQCAPDFIRNSVFADANGWVDVDQYTLRHKTFQNVWGLGDVTNTPNAKTMAAVRKQAPVVAQNITDVLNHKSPSVAYDGYGSCPLTVERGKIVLAEFAYGGKLAPSFPKWLNDGTQPTRLAWRLKADVLPMIYWHGMLKGHEWMASPQKITT